jgi:hypothetical protein
MLTHARSLNVAASFLLLSGMATAQESPLAAQAVVRFTFSEENGSAKDVATAGQVSDEGKLVNDPVRVASPFWNQNGKRALQLDAARQQYVEIADSADVDAPDGVTVSMFVVNLTEPTDATYHGLFAKRGTADGKFSTNYGINFQMQSDAFQVYIHDGTDYRVANFGAKQAVPFRKLAYVTATFTTGDAPGQDADTDADDVRMQYFVNGEPLVPTGVGRGFVNGHEAWTLDVNLAGLLNSLPVTIGRSEISGEYTSCVLGDFTLIPRALSAEDVKALFIQVAGANVRELIAADKATPPVVPVIGGLSQPGLQTGTTTQLVLDGSALGPNSVAVFPLPEIRFAVVEGSTPNRLVLNVTVPADAVPGIYPLWVTSQAGASKSVPLAIDRLPQAAMGSTHDQPAKLPAAFFGSLSGGQQQQIYFSGTKGQRVVADVELKRLGGIANPVVEIKTPFGTPLTIGWGQNSLRGDARAEVILPADGIYAVELHDLTFNAPGANPFRIKVGNLKLVDGILPAAAVPGTMEIELMGTGFAPGTRVAGQFVVPAESSSGLFAVPIEVAFAGSLPPVALSRGIEIIENSASADGTPQTVDVTLIQPSMRPVAINGRILVKNEHDHYLLNVTPGQKLRLTLQSDSIGSSLEGEIRLLGYPQADLLAMTSDQPTIGDPTIDFNVPAGISRIQVQVRDLFRRGDPRSFYRLAIEPADQPRFSMALTTSSVNLPDDGSAIMELQVTRAGYAGPIKLSVVGDQSVTVSPKEIAANLQGKTLLRLLRNGQIAATAPALLRIVGESVEVEPTIKRAARLPTGSVSPTFTDTMAVGITGTAGMTVALQTPPVAIFRGATIDLGLVLTRSHGQPAATSPVRLSLLSTEPSRKRDPNNPAAGDFPLVAVGPRMVLPTESEPVSVKLAVPLESVEPAIEFVIRADAAPHAYSDRVLATAYSEPFHVEIKNGVTPKIDDATLAFAGEVDHKLTGILGRTPGFAAPVEVTLVGLPAGYTMQAGNVPGDQDKFELLIKAPKVTTETAVANVKLRVTSAGSLLVPEIPVNLKVIP